MTVRPSILIILLITSVVAKSQRLQVGVSGSLNTTFFHKSGSSFDDRYFSSGQLSGFGISIPAYIPLNRNWTLSTGIGFQYKQYRIVQREFGIPEVGGYAYLNESFITAELPVLLSFKSSGSEKYKIEYKAGCILSLNSPLSTTIGTRSQGTGERFSLSASTSQTDWEQTFSPDLYVGISVVNFQDNLRTHQFTISYQYGLIPTARSEFSTEAKNSTESEAHHATFKPTLSVLSLSYSLFPKWLAVRDKAAN